MCDTKHPLREESESVTRASLILAGKPGSPAQRATNERGLSRRQPAQARRGTSTAVRASMLPRLPASVPPSSIRGPDTGPGERRPPCATSPFPSTLSQNLAPWPDRAPPVLELVHQGGKSLRRHVACLTADAGRPGSWRCCQRCCQTPRSGRSAGAVLAAQDSGQGRHRSAGLPLFREPSYHALTRRNAALREDLGTYRA